MKNFQELLKKLHACSDAREWAGEMTIEQVAEKCHRGDWLLWLAKRVNVDDRKLTIAKGHCANTVRHLMKDNRSVDAVDAAIAYGKGEITRDELNQYASAADAADAAYAAAASAAAYDYAAAASAAASGDRINNQLETANICRQYIGQAIIDKVNELLKQEVV